MPEEKAIATLDTPVDELEQKLVDETDIDELKQLHKKLEKENNEIYK